MTWDTIERGATPMRRMFTDLIRGHPPHPRHPRAIFENEMTLDTIHLDSVANHFRLDTSWRVC
jgi:hypothetical protein